LDSSFFRATELCLNPDSQSDIDSSYTSFSSDTTTRGGDNDSVGDRARLLGGHNHDDDESEEGKWIDYTVQELNFEINKQIGRFALRNCDKSDCSDH